MIDKNQLIQLGWSEELINEVTRISEEIKSTIKEPKELVETNVKYSSESGNSIYFSAPEINASTHILLTGVKK